MKAGRSTSRNLGGTDTWGGAAADFSRLSGPSGACHVTERALFCPRMCDRNGGRRLRQWLIEQIDSGMYPGLIWENDEKSMFRIPWKHAGKQDYNQEVDASIFKVRT